MHEEEPTLMYVTAVNIKKSHLYIYFSIQIYFGTVFLRQCMCVYERYMLKIQYLLQIYNKRIVKTNQGNNMKTQ